MHYYIDGYNLMFRMRQKADSLEEQREKTLEELEKKIQKINLDATIVFDAQYQLDLSSRTHKGALEICFTDRGETADDYIISELKACENPRNETVITSDNRLAWRARQKNAKTESVEDFLLWLNKRAQKQSKKHVILEKRVVVRGSVIEPNAPKAPLPGTVEYYQAEFEKRVPELKAKSEPAKSLERQEKTKPKKREEESSEESEMARWLRLFGGQT